MGILDILFGNKVEIIEKIDDLKLGSLLWNEDEESWQGNFKGYLFLISLEKEKSEPTSEILNYAYHILANTEILKTGLESEKLKYLARYPKDFMEVETLKYESVSFYRYKSKENRIIASLTSSSEYRAWRIEFSNETCEGLGFDT